MVAMDGRIQLDPFASGSDRYPLPQAPDGGRRRIPIPRIFVQHPTLTPPD